MAVSAAESFEESAPPSPPELPAPPLEPPELAAPLLETPESPVGPVAPPSDDGPSARAALASLAEAPDDPGDSSDPSAVRSTPLDPPLAGPDAASASLLVTGWPPPPWSPGASGAGGSGCGFRSQPWTPDPLSARHPTALIRQSQEHPCPHLMNPQARYCTGDATAQLARISLPAQSTTASRSALAQHGTPAELSGGHIRHGA
jgi:hypothetical protein